MIFFFGTQRRRSHFFPPRPLPYFPCLLSCIVTSHLLRDSLCIALQTEKIMDLINWSLNAIDTIFSTRSWRYLTIRNHDNRSFADRIRLCPGLSKNSEKREQLSKASQGCPSWLKQWEERSALRLRLLTAIWILSWRSSLLCKGKLTVSETRMDKESSRGIGNAVTRPKTKQSQSYLFGSPEPALASAKAAAGKSTLERALQCDALAFHPQF